MRVYGFGPSAKCLAILAILMCIAGNIAVMGNPKLTKGLNQMDGEVQDTGTQYRFVIMFVV